MPSEYRSKIKDYMKGYRQYLKNPDAPITGGTDYSKVKNKQEAKFNAFESAKSGLSSMPDTFNTRLGRAKKRNDMANGTMPYHTRRQKVKYDRRVKKDYNKDMLPKPTTKPPEPGPGPTPVPNPSPSPTPTPNPAPTNTNLSKNKKLPRVPPTRF